VGRSAVFPADSIKTVLYFPLFHTFNCAEQITREEGSSHRMPDPFTIETSGYIAAKAPHWLEDLSSREQDTRSFFLLGNVMLIKECGKLVQ
jgi:hypothetical protein